MESDKPPPSRVEVLGGPIAAARGTLRETLGALRNLSQLLHSLRVAPKSLSQVLPDLLDACTPLRTSVHTLLRSLETRRGVEPACRALEAFFLPRIAELEAGLREAMARPLNAKSRLALEDVVAKSSYELDAARELMQLLEDAVYERSMRLDPRELVRQAFSTPPSSRAEGRTLVSAMLGAHDAGQEIDINPRSAMVLIALGVELVAARPGREAPHVVISSDDRTCRIRVTRKAFATGEPLVLVARGIIEPTLPCVRSAATLSSAELEWYPASEEFSLSYPLPGSAARHDEVG